MGRPLWREKFTKHGSCMPKNFEEMIKRRKPIGQNGAAQCVALSRSTGERCKGLAVTGVSTCRAHGGLGVALRKAQKADSRVKPHVSDARASRRYDASVAFLDDLPQELRKQDPEEHVGARGRRIAAALNRDLNR